MKNEKLIYIILVNYNGIDHTLECIQSIKKINYKNYKIIVVDNKSVDSSVDVLKENKDIILIENKDNIGFAGANNIGIKYALSNNADYVLLLNNDTIVDENFLISLINTSESDKKIGITTSKIYYYDEKDRFWYAGGDVNYIKGNSVVFHLDEIDEGQVNSNCRVRFASGCCMLIKKEVLINVGFINEEYFLYYEDLDYCMEVINAGYEIVLVQESIIYHKESAATKKFSYNYQYYFIRNRLIFIKRNLKILNKITAYPTTILWMFYKILCNEFTFKPCFEGLKDFFANKNGKK